MSRHIFKRLLLFIPTIFVVSLVIFFLNKSIDADPVNRLLATDLSRSPSTVEAIQLAHRRYYAQAQRFYLDKPDFYFSISPDYWPDSLFSILPLARKKAMKSILKQSRRGDDTKRYFQSLDSIQYLVSSLDEVPENERSEIIRILEIVRTQSDKNLIVQNLGRISNITTDESIQAKITGLNKDVDNLFNKSNRLAIPVVRWHGIQNQYHYWFSGFIKGDIGISLRDSRPVGSKIIQSLKWSLVINVFAFFLALLAAVPIGVYSAVARRSWFDKLSSFSLYTLYSTPQFWLATLLLVFLTTPDYGAWTDWFPSTAPIFVDPQMSEWEKILRSSHHLVLPTFCLTVVLLAFLARQMRASTLEELSKEYVLNANALGIPKGKIIWQYVVPNASFPLITYLGMALPFLITGSVVIESIFNVPGMGWLAFDSLITQDWPVLFAILILVAFITMLGMLVADILYVLANPKISRNGG